MMFNLTTENSQLVAAKHYDDIAATDQDFQEDFRRFLLIKRLFNSYLKTGELKERLILNHIIIILNVFGEASVDLLLHELQPYHPQLLPFLILVHRWPPKNFNNTTSVALDENVIKCLRMNI